MLYNGTNQLTLIWSKTTVKNALSPCKRTVIKMLQTLLEGSLSSVELESNILLPCKNKYCTYGCLLFQCYPVDHLHCLLHRVSHSKFESPSICLNRCCSSRDSCSRSLSSDARSSGSKGGWSHCLFSKAESPGPR